jgi:peptidoglycan/LPS O-acetylase OafA/YrhL
MQRLIHGKILAGALSLLVAIALAVLTRVLVEKPAEKLRARLRHKDRTPPHTRKPEFSAV